MIFDTKHYKTKLCIFRSKPSWHSYTGPGGYPIEVRPSKPIHSLLRVAIQLVIRTWKNIVAEIKGENK